MVNGFGLILDVEEDAYIKYIRVDTSCTTHHFERQTMEEQAEMYDVYELREHGYTRASTASHPLVIPGEE